MTFAIVCCLFGGIFGVDGVEQQVARAEGTIPIYAETGKSIVQGNTGTCYVYVDNTVDLASLTVAVHYDSQKMSVTGYYNRATCSIYDASNNDGCLKFSYIFDAEGSATKTALFYFYYKINSDAEIGNTGFDVVVEEAYTTTLEVAPYSGSRCSFDITEKKVVNTCSVYGTSTINTSVKETFEIDYRLSTCYIASGSIDVKYDPELFEFVELTQGNFLNGKVVDVNSSQRGTISLSFLATEYNYYSDLVKVKFRTLKNETTTSQIQLQVNDLYNLDLSSFSCSGYTTAVNVTFDSVYAEDAPSMILGASFLESTEQVLVTVLLEEGSRLGAGDFVLNFDTDDLEFVSYEKGFTPSFFNVNDKSVADGVLKFSVISMTDIVDEQTVLTVLFSAKRECVNKTSNITISGTGLTDSLTNGILLNFVDTTANIPLKHSPAASVEEVTKAPTCTSKGSYDDVVYCSICEAELSRQSNVLDALGHDLTPHDSKKPTCTEIGWNTYVTCSRCDYTTYAEIPATGHTESAVVVENNVAPTCTVTGSYDNVVYCATCDTELSRTTITVEALGHDLVEHSAKAPTCTEIGWNAYVTCSRCEYTTYAEIPATGHSHNAVVTAPTCTEEGYTTYTCHCGDTFVADKVAALGHDLLPHDSKAPTCTAIGWNTYVTCSRCDYTTYAEIPATGHTESAVVVENNVAPTCTVTGSYDNVVYCATCDAELNRTTITVDALGHDIINHEEKAPTCTEIGWNTYVTCSRCDYTTYQEIPATGHSHNAVVTAPTCTEEGYTTYTCYCGDTYVANRVAALGHDAVPHDSKAPTCTQIGWNAYVTCSRCDYTTYQEIPATGHSHNAVVTAPTCTEQGYTTHTCHCGDEYTDSYVDALGHDAIPHDSKAPTCIQIGWNAYVTCSRCEYTTYAEISATGHSHNAVVTAPTCTAEGYTTYTCHCGDTYVADIVAALGHDTISHNAQAPTCTEVGWEAYVTCSRCDHTTYAEIPATGHTESAVVVENNVAPTCTVTGSYDNVVYCATCDTELSRTIITVEALGHDLVEHSAKAPTCTEIGWNTYVTCSRCDYTTYAEIPATGHTESAVVVENNVAPTCTVTGSYDNVVYCAICDAELSRDEVVVPALGHDLLPHDSKAPTCTAIGWNTYVTCSRCDYTTYQELPATGHTESAVVVENNVAPTCTATGSYDNVVYCSTCDAELSRDEVVVPALGHDLISHDSKAPTCTAIGWNTYVTCSRCDYTTYAEIPATGHSHSAVVTSPTCTTQGYTTHTCHCGDSYIDSYVGALGHEEVIDKAVSPTCTATGFTEGKHCSVCDEVLVKQEVVEALGHDEITHNAKTPTCTEIGWNAYVTCSRCDYTTYQEIPATGHTESAVVVENNVAPTCTATGSYDNVVYCSTCDAELSRDEVVVPALGHDLIPHDSKAPTCTAIGWNTYVTCSRCDHTTYAEIPATGHTESAVVVENNVAPTCTVTGSYDNVVYCATCDTELSRTTIIVDALGHDPVEHSAKAPTCTEIGWDKYETCSRCDYTTYTEIPAKGHTESSAVVENTVAPTCTVAGSHDNVVYCSTCDAELSRDEVVVPALGHDLIPHDSKKPTCTEIGWNTYVTCSRCDHTTYQEIPATGHIDANNDKLCDVCDASLCDVHTPSENLAFDEEGHWSVCSVCGYALEKVEHTYETATTAPTCLEQGYTTFTCHCGHSYKSNFVDASGHTKASAVIENKIEPTCVNNGRYEKVVYCSICGDEVSRERVTLYATGHDIVMHNSKAPTCTAIGWNEYETCSRCDYNTYTEIPATGHTPAKAVIENMVSATCLQAGEYDSVVYCATCGEEVSRQAKTILALGHYIIHNAEKEATCTEDGWDAYDMCARCDYSTYRVVSALGHDLIPHDSKAPTCTDIGWNTYVTCSRCDHTTYAEIPATGHSHNAVVTEPTCTEQGYTTHTCHCGDEYTDSYVDALGHDAIPHDSKAPTCTEIGWSAYVTCSRCDHTTYAEIPATGHSTTSHEAKKPTCTEIGWNAYVTCDKCDYTTYEELAKTPHLPSDAVRENVVESTTETEGHYDSVVYCSVCGHEILREQKTTPIISNENISDPNSGEKGLGVGEIAAIATTTSASATGGIAALVSFILKRRKIKIKK